MSFTKDHRRRFVAGRPRFVLPPFAASPMLRLVVFALAALGAASYGLVRHFTTTLPPMIVQAPTPPPAPTYDADAGEIPVPESWLQEEKGVGDGGAGDASKGLGTGLGEKGMP